LRVTGDLFKRFISKDKLKKICKYTLLALKKPGLIKKFALEVRQNGLETAVIKIKNYNNFIVPEIVPEYVTFNDETKNIILNYLNNNSTKVPILLFSHELTRTGAPIIILNIARELFNTYNRSIILITLIGGELYDDFSDFCAVINLEQNTNRKIQNENLVENLISFLSGLSVNQAILNTLGGGLLIPYLEKHFFHYLILVHELFDGIKAIEWDKNVIPLLKQKSDYNKLIFSSAYTYNQFISNFSLSFNMIIFPQGCMLNGYKDNSAARIELRSKLGLKLDAKIVIGSGKGFARKGIDLFYEIARKAVQSDLNLYFIWLGDTSEKEVKEIIENEKNKSPSLHEKIIILDFVKDPALYFAGSDVFALSSREDPFPNVVLEALSMGIPTLAFADCGGAPEILNKIDKRLIINKFDLTDFAGKIEWLLNDNKSYQQIAAQSSSIITSNYQFSDYVKNLTGELEQNLKVTVIVPSYNYERYLLQRLNSIISQSVKPHEIIFLDDCSSDNSVEVAAEILAKTNIPYKIIKNEHNQGVYSQWIKGINLAEGEIIWIAEADDYCESTFLKDVSRFFADKTVNIAYCQSRLVDSEGNITSEHVLSHTDELSTTKWLKDYIETGKTEIINYSFYRNTIMNVSSALLRKSACKPEFFTELMNYKYAGDWYLYLSILMNGGKIGYSRKSLNSFRRHKDCVTLKNFKNDSYLEELIKIKKLILLHYNIPETSIQRGIDLMIKDFGYDKVTVTQNCQVFFQYSAKEKLTNK
jgi:glycosyltransferase involved in cell wall biosynthesis